MLTEEQLREIEDFCDSTAAKTLFDEMEAGLMQDWSMTTDLASREQLWSDMQALRRLQVALRDATANKRLTQRARAGSYTA